MTIGERMQADLSAFMPLPQAPHDACHKVATRVSSLSLVRYRNNHYSVPIRYGRNSIVASASSMRSLRPSRKRTKTPHSYCRSLASAC
jgi:hypothetical protein